MYFYHEKKNILFIHTTMSECAHVKREKKKENKLQGEKNAEIRHLFFNTCNNANFFFNMICICTLTWCGLRLT